MTLTENDLLIPTDVLERVLSRASVKGAEFAEIFVEDRQGSSIALDNKKIEELSSGHDQGAGIRVVVGDITGYAHTQDLSENGLLEAAEAAAAVAKERTHGNKTISMDAKKHIFGETAAKIHPTAVGKKDKVALLLAADDASRSASGQIAQVQIGYGDSRRRILVANSDGLLATDDQIRTRISVFCVALGDGGLQTGYETLALGAGFEIFDEFSIAEVAKEASRIALSKLNAKPAPSGILPVVIKSGTGGILFHEACGHGLEADHILKDSSVYTNRVGETVANPKVTLIDDGTLTRGWGTSTIDDEGHTVQSNVLIKDGVLTDYMWDYLRARKEKRASSGNGRRQSYQYLPMVRMTNTYLINGEDNKDAIIADTKYGVYVSKLGGGQVNTATGDFVFGMTEAYLIENGRITEPLRDANLIGNGPEVLQNIDAVADDFDVCPGTCGKDGQSVPVGCGQPTLRISQVTVGGTAGA
ncbi:MAG: TldD/PmbA family protein [Firmicutes bacterium]|nr:TldD/PmbA family protein [Bacillota bacterium]